MAWEEVLVSSVHLLKTKTLGTPRERGATIVGNLLSFDCYGRSSDIALALTSELRRPSLLLPLNLRQLTLTLNPLDPFQQTYSTTDTVDDTISIGNANPERRWITKLLPSLLAMKRNG